MGPRARSSLGPFFLLVLLNLYKISFGIAFYGGDGARRGGSIELKTSKFTSK